MYNLRALNLYFALQKCYFKTLKVNFYQLYRFKMLVFQILSVYCYYCSLHHLFQIIGAFYFFLNLISLFLPPRLHHFHYYFHFLILLFLSLCPTIFLYYHFFSNFFLVYATLSTISISKRKKPKQKFRVKCPQLFRSIR